MEFTEEQWQGLAEHAADRGLIFLSSPFSLEAVELLERLGAPAWKVGAGEIGNLPMLERMAATGRPVLLSSGMASLERTRRGRRQVRMPAAHRGGVAMHDGLSLPAGKAGLELLAELRERYGCPVGLSDHSGHDLRRAGRRGAGSRPAGSTRRLLARMLRAGCAGVADDGGTANNWSRACDSSKRAMAHPIDKEAHGGRDVAAESACSAKAWSPPATCRPDIASRPTTWRFKKPGTGIPASAAKRDRRPNGCRRTVAADTLLVGGRS